MGASRLRFPKIRPPTRISTQVILLLAASILAIQINQSTHQWHNTPPKTPLPIQVQPLMFIVEALLLMPPDRRPLYAEKLNAATPDAVFKLLPTTAPELPDPPDDILATQLLPVLPKGTRLGSAGDVMQIRCPDGLVLEVLSTHFKPPSPQTFVVTMSFLIMLVSIVCFLLYVYFYLRRPLDAVAEAVDRFGRDQTFEVIPERGPTEIADIARVLNQMQERITTMLTDRTRTLAALGHDLRTPITRMRLHAERVGETAVRTAMISDLDYMQRMTHAALTFLRGGTVSAKAPTDVASLCLTICDEADEMGQPVAYTGPDHLIIDANTVELRRAVTNLVVNAVFQQANVVVAVRDRDPDTVDIEVIDDGPGISDDEKARAFEPFWRGERNRYDRTGLGLGLSIVYNVARSHDGEVSLHDREGGGLICRLRLPRGVSGDVATHKKPDGKAEPVSCFTL